MPRPIHFEIHCDNPERAMRFYEELFGWTFSKWDGPMPYWLVKTGEDGTPGINGGLMQRMGPHPVDGQALNGYVCTIDVNELDQTVTSATGMGANIALPKMPIPGVGWLAYLKDPEGNVFGVMQYDPVVTA